MSRDGSVIIEWAGAPRLFRLAWGEVFRVQEATDCGPYRLAERMMGDDWRSGDVSAVILYGLIGGGASVADAVALVRSCVEAKPPAENVNVARAVIAAAVYPPDDEIIEFKGSPAPEKEMPNGKVRASNLYGNGAIMGMSPEQVDRSSIWQFSAAMAGFNRSNSSGLSNIEMDDLWAGVQERMH